MKCKLFIAGIAVFFGALTSHVQAQWGDLTATFILDGKAPESKPLTVTKDQQVCGNTIPDDSLIVSSSGGIANVIVAIYLKETDPLPPIHDDYKKSAGEKVELDNHKCRFEPHIAVLRVGQPLILKNSDAVGHNTKIDVLNNTPVNPIIPSNAQLEQKFNMEERLPANVSCSIHPWMSAKLVVKKHPYVGVSDKDGKLTIKNMPVGKWSLQVWHESSGYVSEVKQDGKAAKWAKGRVEFTVKAGANSLGEVKVPPTAFKKS